MDVSFLYTVDPYADEPIMLIDKHIGFDKDDGFGIMGDVFQRELLALDGMGKKRIQVWINSPGGIVADGYNIHNAILKSKTPVDTYCMGIAASIAGVFFQAGRKRIMADYSKLMYHNPFGGDENKGLDAIRDSLATMIASRCGKTEDEIKKLMNRTTWIGAAEALDNGFCDEMQASADVNKKRSFSTITETKALWKGAGEVLNSLFPLKINSFDMKKIANRLKLVTDASEESVIEAIDVLEASNKDLHGQVQNHLKDIQNRKTAMEKKEEEYNTLKAEADKAKAELEEMKNKAKAKADADLKKEEEEKEEKAKNMIEGFVTTGRIKNDAKIIADWTAKAKADFDGVKNLIESLPINKAAAKIDITKTGTSAGAKGKIGSVIANTMHEKFVAAAGKV